jgi:hypothetical protein
VVSDLAPHGMFWLLMGVALIAADFMREFSLNVDSMPGHVPGLSILVEVQWIRVVFMSDKPVATHVPQAESESAHRFL